MKIQDTKEFVLVAKCIKNTGKSIAKIKFDYSFCKDKNLIKKAGGRVYLICVNDVIYKIGYSRAKSGMKGTLGSYEGSMGGKPGINRYGIHILINDELNKENDVSIYVKYSPVIKLEKPIMGLNKKHKIETSPAHEFEDICKEDYTDFEKGRFPKWNYQEKREQWPQKIQKKHNRHRANQIEKNKNNST